MTSAGRSPFSRLDAQCQQDGAAQFRAPDRFGEVGGDAQLAASGGIARLAGRGEHHDGGAGDRRILLDGLGQRKAIRIGHLDIGQHEPEGPSRFLRRAQRRERFGHAGRQRRRPCATRSASLRAGAGSWRCRRRRGPAGPADRPRPEPAPPAAARSPARNGGEMEGAALAGFTLHPEAPAHQLHELRRDRQAKSGAAIRARRRAVGLRERLEDALLTVQRDADARVPDREVQHDVLAASPPRSSREARPRPGE